VADPGDPGKQLIELHIQEDLELLHQYEGSLRLASDPGERRRFQNEINKLKTEIAWLQRQLGEDTPADRLVGEATRLWIGGELYGALELLEQARTINPYRQGLGSLTEAIRHELSQPWIDRMTGRVMESRLPPPAPSPPIATKPIILERRRPLWPIVVVLVLIIALAIGLFFLLRFWGVI
jgi:hypothetical protein